MCVWAACHLREPLVRWEREVEEEGDGDGDNGGGDGGGREGGREGEKKEMATKQIRERGSCQWERKREGKGETE